MSLDAPYIDNIMAYQPNRNKLTACHNFYPQQYTGLSEAFFIKTSKRFKEQQIRTACFVNSNHAEIGPWPIMTGLCTLEQHRFLKLTT